MSVLIKSILNIPLGLLDILVSKDQKIIVFSGNNLKGINGNVSAVLRKWCEQSKNSDYKGYVLGSKCKKIEGLNTIQPISLKGILVLLKSGTVVISHGPGDIFYKSLANIKRRKIINLWHGVPLKNIGRWKGWECSILITASDTERKLMSKMTGTPIDKIVVTGYPRTDDLINKPNQLKKEALRKLNKKGVDQKWILYAPTYRNTRNSKGYIHELPDFSRKELIVLLEKNNAYLLIRPHVNDPLDDLQNHKRILFADSSSFPDIEPLYSLSDILVTDYSSIIFEYALLDKPLIGIASDLEQYKKKPGLLFDYDEFFPGPNARNWKELKSSLGEALSGTDDYKIKRRKFSNKFNKFKDGKNTERVLNIICGG